MRINEVVSELKKNPGNSFTAVYYEESSLKLNVFQASNEEDDPDWITVSYDGGVLFSSSGEEEVYSIDELPEEVSLLEFKPTEELNDVSSGYTVEHMAYMLFPNLPDPETILSEQQKKSFSSELARMLKSRN